MSVHYQMTIQCDNTEWERASRELPVQIDLTKGDALALNCLVLFSHCLHVQLDPAWCTASFNQMTTHEKDKESALNWIIRNGIGMCLWWYTHSSASCRASLPQTWCSSKCLLHLPTAEGDERHQSIQKNILHSHKPQLFIQLLLSGKWLTLVSWSVTHPWFDQQAASYTEHSGQSKGSAHCGQKQGVMMRGCHTPQYYSCSCHDDWDTLTQKQQHSKQRDARVQVGKVILPQVWNSKEES